MAMADTCLFCGQPVGENPVYDEANGETACAACGAAEIKAQKDDLMTDLIRRLEEAKEGSNDRQS